MHSKMMKAENNRLCDEFHNQHAKVLSPHQVGTGDSSSMRRMQEQRIVKDVEVDFDMFNDLIIALQQQELVILWARKQFDVLLDSCVCYCQDSGIGIVNRTAGGRLTDKEAEAGNVIGGAGIDKRNGAGPLCGCSCRSDAGEELAEVAQAGASSGCNSQG